MSRHEVLLGWRNLSPQAALAFPPPRLVAEMPSAEAAGPLAERLVAIRAGGSVRARLVRGPGAAMDVGLMREPGAMSPEAFHGLFHRVEPSSQRNGEVPAVQMALNIQFVCEEEASLQLLPPVFEPGYRSWPGTLVCGRFPLRAWPRPLNAVLEWDDPARDWTLTRGEPVAYALIDFHDPRARPRLVEARSTPALTRHLARIDDVSSVGRNVGPMFREAAERRPARLLEPKTTYADSHGAS